LQPLEINSNQIWTSEIASTGCVPEVFDCKELISWCIDKFDKNQRIIQLQGESPISLTPSVFKIMFKLPEPTMNFKGDEAKDFLKARNGGLEILQEYLEDPTLMPEDLSAIQVSLLKKPYQEMAWLFSRVAGKESTATIPHLVLYILYFSIHKKAIFDWAKIISGELSFQLENFRKSKKFYMSSYLIFSITYCHVFKGLHLAKQVNCKIDPVHTWYPALWKQKAMYHFYEVHNSFVSSFKKLIFGPKTSRLSLEATTFLDKRGSFKAMEHFNIIKDLLF
jgi:hypothetical protein